MKEQVWIGLWSNFRRRALRCFLYAAMMGMSLGLSSLASFRGQEIGSFVVRNSTLKDALKQLEKQVDVGFFYDAKDVEKVRDITLNISNATLENVLSRLFAGTGFTYEILDDNVVITREKVVVEQKSIPMQKIKITVRDADSGESLIGATAIIRGTTIGGAADIDGVIVLDAVPENAVIDVKFLGKKSVEVKVVKGKTEYTVSLKDEALQFDEVVVTGYQTIERGRATGSFEVVRNKDLEMVVSNDVADKLEGVVPGLAVDGNGDMLIRGQATIYAETKPLVVVDGFPMEYGTVNINPNDIEQISVLKDAAAASIWGVRAANGVIVITTKKGKKNQPVTVSYTGNVKIGSKFDVSSLGRLNSRQWIDWEREQFFYRPSDIANIGTSYGSFTEAALIEYRYQNGQLDEAGRDAAYEQLGSYDNSRDIEKYFYRNSLLHSHNLVISGGSERMTNYFSVNYENKLGDLIGNSTDHVTVQLNSTMELFKRVSLLAGVRANYDNTEAYTGSPTSMRPYVRLKDENGGYVNEYAGASEFLKEELYQKGYTDWSYNRLKDRPETDNTTKSYNVAANLQLDIDLSRGFKFTTSGMYITDNSTQEILRNKQSYYVRDLFNRFTQYDAGTGKLINHLPDGAIKDVAHHRSTSYTFRNVLNYNFNNDLWSASAMIGCEMFAIRTQMETDTFYGYDPQGLTFNTTMNFKDLVTTGVTGFSPSAGRQKLSYNPQHGDAEDRYFSTFFTGNVSYADRYVLFGSVRYDKTNLYGRSGKYRDQPTWSIGGKWNVSSESFFEVPVINQLGIKLSYGLSGNIDKSTSPYLIAENTRDVRTGLPVLNIRNPENKELGWEKVYTFNAGVNLGLFDDRLNLTVDYYNRKTEDALGFSMMDPTSGWSSVKKNTASLFNRGVDLSVGGYPVSTKEVRWNTSLTFSYNYNEVTKVNSGVTTPQSVLSGNPVEGKPVDYLFYYRAGKLTAEGAPTILDNAGHELAWNSSVQVEDMRFGRKSPQIFGAWSNTVSCKGFDLSMMFTYKMKYEVRMPSVAGSYGSYKTFDQRWRKPGDEENTWVPKPLHGSFNYTFQNVVDGSDKQLEKGNMIRLKSVGLAYDFKRLVKTDVLSALSLKFSVENPWFWASNRDGLDVDRLYESTNSTVFYSGKQPTYYTFTLNVKF